MALGSIRESGRLRNRLVVVALIALVTAVAGVLRSRRPQLAPPVPEPPRIGYSRNGAAPSTVSV
ncbi:hypothetical protein [Nocardia sp. alder85J]|uniref:hypothetical protein n=1 Tax=Nocardia sp. alder85J TaxID=2862949 RepID=UPI001CD2762C|nr:hypothetical protein [Nocardia sp. alder85J]MCX4096548.1 hypothetical protein [Nocardia sp. alder85J]